METHKSSYSMDKYIDEPVRYLDIQISDDKLEVYVSIQYLTAALKGNGEKSVSPPVYKEEEIKSELLKQGIVYGIIEENLKKCTNPQGVFKQLIAKGDEAQDGVDDKLNIHFDVDDTIKKLQEDNNGNVDFKSIGSVKSVKQGEVIASKIFGSAGIDGKDVKGRIIKHKEGKKLTLQAGNGCEIADNTIVASIDGKPCKKNNKFYVYSVHELQGDVELKTGNIDFSGDIIVHGNVREGMKVHSGNCIIIKNSVERSEVLASGDILVGGNIIGSKITSGGEDSEKLKLIEKLETLNLNINELVKAVEEIKQLNLLRENVSDGQMIKMLLETKFKELLRLSSAVLTELANSDDEKDIRIAEIIKNKLIGLGPVSIKHYSELRELSEYIQEKKDYLKKTLSVPVNVKVSYIQDSIISSSGDIIVDGIGSYLSKLYAHNSIVFTREKSVVRGGVLIASNEIRCKIVGSNAGALTKLVILENGHIFIDIAYENTALVVGKREYVIESASRNVHAYLNKDGELNIDRLKL